MYNPRNFKHAQFSRRIEQAENENTIINVIYRNDVEKLKQLISMGENVNVCTSEGGKTPLHIACETFKDECVKELILAGADINAQTKNGFTPLHVASQIGAANIVEMLCNTQGIKINVASNKGCTPLHESAAKGHIQATLILLRFKADPNIRDKQHNLTAANLASIAGHTHVGVLLKEIMTYEQNFIQHIHSNLFVAKNLPLENPSAYKFLEKISTKLIGIEDGDTVFKILKEHFTSAEYEPLKVILSEVKKMFIQNMNTYNQEKIEAKQIKDPLAILNSTFIKACKQGLVKLVLQSLKNPLLDPALDDNYGIQTAAGRGHLDIVELLLKTPGVDPAAKGNCALAWACENGNTEVVRLLLNDPRVTPVTDNHYALTHSVKNGNTEVVKLLLADPRIVFKVDSIEVDCNTGANYSIAETLIKCASSEGHAEIVNLLLNDSRINLAVDNNYPIRAASQEGHIDVVNLLIQDPRVDPTVNNNYPINAALKNRHFEVVRLLLVPSTPSLKDLEGTEKKEELDKLVNNTLLKGAYEAGDMEFAKFLVERGAVIEEGLDKKFNSSINLSRNNMSKKVSGKKYK